MLLQTQTRKNHYIALILLLLIFTGIVLLLVHFGKLRIVNTIEFAGLFTVAGFVVVIFQLWQENIVQRAKFLTEYLTNIYTDEELNSAFHALVETYNDSLFDQIDKIAQETKAKEKSETTNAPVFDVFKDLQGPRAAKEGYRYYHPECFQGSEEERRLDALIGYLDIVGYHYWYGMIRMRDIAALLNYHLATFASRKVVARYLKVSGEEWWKTTAISTGSKATQLPYLYFRHMLGDFVAYNAKNAAKIQRMQTEIASRMKGQYL